MMSSTSQLRLLRSFVPLNWTLASSFPPATSKIGPYAYCISVVRQFDMEGFLCASFMRRSVKPAIFSILAFNAELSRIPSLSNSAAVNRFDFWKDIVHAAYEGEHWQIPIAQALSDTIRKYNLSKKWLLDLVEARRIWRQSNVYKSFATMEDYFSKTFVTVIYLILQIYRIEGLHTDHVANHVGKAVGFANTLRSIGLYGDKGASYVIPTELLNRYKLTADNFKPERANEISIVIEHIAEHAAAHLQRARSFKEKVPRKAAEAFLFSAIADNTLRLLRQCSYNPFDPRIQQRSAKLIIDILKHRLLGTY